MKRSSRYIVALVLTVIYLLITMSPLAPLVLLSPAVAHAVTGECAGNCDICGCSLERRAGKTCCCWLKKLKKEHDHEQEQLPDCCKKKHKAAKPELKCNCPCGSGKHIALWGADNNEQIPCQIIAGIPFSYGNIPAGVYERRLTDRFGDPPDPPPKLTAIS
jgi:hypothetical protein